MMTAIDTRRIERVIVAHLPPSVSEDDIAWAKCQLCWELAEHFASEMPEKYRTQGKEILEKSVAFRLWFLGQFDRFNTGIASLFTDNLIDGTISLEDWMNVQRNYFDETLAYPDTATIREAIREYHAHKLSPKEASNTEL